MVFTPIFILKILLPNQELMIILIIPIILKMGIENRNQPIIITGIEFIAEMQSIIETLFIIVKIQFTMFIR